MDLQQCIQSRRTIRRFTDQDIGYDQVHLIVESGKYAPSAGNLQNWRYVIVRDQEIKRKVADACVQQFWLETAPVLLVITSDLQQAEEFYGTRGVDVYSRHNAAACAQNMLLAAHDIGLAGAWVGAFDNTMLSSTLGLPEHVRPEIVLAIGHAAEQVPIPARHPFEAITFRDQWGNRLIDKALSQGKTGPLLKEQVTKGIERFKHLKKQLTK